MDVKVVENFLTPEQTQERLGLLGSNTLAVWRHQDSDRKKRGPRSKYAHIKRRPLPWIYLPGTQVVRYRALDLIKWLEAAESTLTVKATMQRKRSPGRPRHKEQAA